MILKKFSLKHKAAGREFFMQLGMPTLIQHESLEEAGKLCRSLGLDFVELNMSMPQYQIENLEETKAFLDVADKYQIYYTIHLDENLDICNFNNAVSKVWIDTVIRTIEIAKKLKVPVLNMHMNEGVHVTLPEQKVYLYEKYKEIYLEKLKIFRDICQREISGRNILISIENTGGYHLFQKEGIELLLESKVFSLTWDIGHSYVNGKADEPYILQHVKRLKHLHIHDAMGNQDHMILGTGQMNLDEKLKIAERYNCRCVLETKTEEALKQSMGWLKEWKKR